MIRAAQEQVEIVRYAKNNVSPEILEELQKNMEEKKKESENQINSFK